MERNNVSARLVLAVSIVALAGFALLACEEASPRTAPPRAPAELTRSAPRVEDPVPTAIAPAPAPVVAPSVPFGEDDPSVEDPADTLAEPELHEIDGVSLARLVVARGVEGREPVGASSRFEGSSDPLYAFLELVNGNDEEREVIVTFEREDGYTTGDVSLTVPANARRWRTWAYSRYVQRAGAWDAVVRTPEGEVVGTVPFVVE